MICEILSYDGQQAASDHGLLVYHHYESAAARQHPRLPLLVLHHPPHNLDYFQSCINNDMIILAWCWWLMIL